MASYLGLEDDRFKGTSNKRRVLKEILYERAEGRCQLCGRPVSLEDAHLDHILPAKQGGANHYTNFQIAHPRCNASKGGKLPAGMKPGTSFRELRRRRERVRDQKLARRREKYNRDLLKLVDSGKWTEKTFRALFEKFRTDCEVIEQSMPQEFEATTT